MITVKRTLDMKLVKSIWGHPEIFYKIITDSSLNINEWMPVDPINRIYLVVYKDITVIGVIALYKIKDSIYDCHIGMIKKYRYGRNTYISISKAIKYMEESFSPVTLLAHCPIHKPEVLKLCLSLGFKLKKRMILKETINKSPMIVDVVKLKV